MTIKFVWTSLEDIAKHYQRMSEKCFAMSKDNPDMTWNQERPIEHYKSDYKYAGELYARVADLIRHSVIEPQMIPGMAGLEISPHALIGRDLWGDLQPDPPPLDPLG